MNAGDLRRKQEKRTPQEPGNWQGLIGLISFSTILPLNIHCSIVEIARFTWLWPLIGALIGLIVGAVGYLTISLLHIPSLLTAAITYSFAISLTGFHHVDGLIDFGDGLMAHAEPQERILIMRDTRLGTGGISLFFIVGIISISALSNFPAYIIPFALIISEIAAKMSIITCCTFSESYADGSGKYFIEAMNFKRLILGLILYLIIGFLVLNLMGMIGILGGVLIGLIIVEIVKKRFRWTTGDILGASNELGRMMSLILMILFMVIS